MLNLAAVCPNSWYSETTLANKCLDFGEVKLKFSDATFYCSTYGDKVSQLSINNAFENNEISSKHQVIKYFKICIKSTKIRFFVLCTFLNYPTNTTMD